MIQNTKSVLAAALASTLLAGCASMGPDHVRPEPATAPAFDPEYRPDGEIVASQMSYRDWFTDPRLVVLIDSALENNRDLLAATARIEQARARYRIQDSRRLPTAVATGSAVRSRQPLDVNPALDTGDVEGAPAGACRGKQARANQHRVQPRARQIQPLAFLPEMACEFGGMEQDDAAPTKFSCKRRGDREMTQAIDDRVRHLDPRRRFERDPRFAAGAQKLQRATSERIEDIGETAMPDGLDRKPVLPRRIGGGFADAMDGQVMQFFEKSATMAEHVRAADQQAVEALLGNSPADRLDLGERFALHFQANRSRGGGARAPAGFGPEQEGRSAHAAPSNSDRTCSGASRSSEWASSRGASRSVRANLASSSIRIAPSAL